MVQQTGNIEDELFLVLWCDTSSSREQIHTRSTFLSVETPKSSSAVGLYELLESALTKIGIRGISVDACKKSVGIGTDGASTNIACGDKVRWIYWMWCLAHRLELAMQDALKDSVLEEINEMLLRLYYLYETSPQKCRELEEIIHDLKGCLEFDEGGVRPIRSCGTHWISHNVSKFGAYSRIQTTWPVYQKTS